MNIFEEVKDLVDVPTAARHYGVEVHKGNMAICPFHHERTPSCKLYDKNYHCFSCKAHGDVIQLVQELFGLSPIDAVRQLNNDFSLGLDMDKPVDTKAISERRQLIEQKKADEERKRHMYDVLLSYFVLLDRYKLRYAPKNHDERLDERYAYAVHHIESIAYLLEFFDLIKDLDEAKEEVDRIEREYKRVHELWGE